MTGSVRISYMINGETSGKTHYTAALEYGQGDKSQMVYASSYTSFEEARAKVIDLYRLLPCDENLYVTKESITKED